LSRSSSRSWGGYLVPRAASGEPCLVACIAGPGQYDLLATIRGRLPLPPAIKDHFPDGDPAIVRTVADRMMGDPAAAWTVRRGMLVHGVETVTDYLRLSARYTLADRAEGMASGARPHSSLVVLTAPDEGVGARFQPRVAASSQRIISSGEVGCGHQVPVA
jgi:hypothetical protein